MPSYSSGNGAFTPSTSQDNWCLRAGASSALGYVNSIGWGGRLTTSTGYRTRWARATVNGSSSFTVLTNAYSQPNYTTMLTEVGTFTTPPTLAVDPGGNLWAQDWNAQGGVGALVLPLENRWWINSLAAAQICCRNVAGTDANGSSYVVEIEDI